MLDEISNPRSFTKKYVIENHYEMAYETRIHDSFTLLLQSLRKDVMNGINPCHFFAPYKYDTRRKKLSRLQYMFQKY